MEARAVVSEYTSTLPDLTIFSEDFESYPQALAENDLFGTLISSCSKESQLRPIPQDLFRITLVIFVLVAIVVGYMQFKKHQAAKARSAEIARRALEDPTPKYLAALAMERNRAGATTASLEEALVVAMKVNALVSGWSVKKIECGLVQNGCHVIYMRSTGTFVGLVRDVTTLGLVPTDKVALNEATMSWTHQIPFAAIASVLPTMQVFVQHESGSKFQTWLTAGLNVQMKPPALWPRAAGVPSNFKTPNGVFAGDIAVSAIGLPQMMEILKAAPENVVWNGFVIEFGQSGKGADMTARGKINGVFYVK
jgi:hypothetical protein